MYPWNFTTFEVKAQQKKTWLEITEAPSKGHIRASSERAVHFLSSQHTLCGGRALPRGRGLHLLPVKDVHLS